jgi:hypothetical protein
VVIVFMLSKLKLTYKGYIFALMGLVYLNYQILENTMSNFKFSVKVSYFIKGELKTIEKRISASSVSLAWRAGLSLIPISSTNQIQIKVVPV